MFVAVCDWVTVSILLITQVSLVATFVFCREFVFGHLRYIFRKYFIDTKEQYL